MSSDARRAAAPVLALLCAVLLVAQLNWRPAEFALVVELKTDSLVRLQLRYGGDRGRAEQSVTRTVRSHHEFVSVTFPITSTKLRDLRLLQVGFPQAIELRSLRLARLGTTPRILTRADLTPMDAATQIIEAEAGVLSVSSTSSAAPAINISPPRHIKSSWLGRLFRWTLVIALAAASVSLVLALNFAPIIHPKRSGLDDSARRNIRRGVIIALITGYFLASLLKLNGSSTGLWRQYADGRSAEEALIVGTPKAVRSDEWMLQTPWMFSQAAQVPAFPTENTGIGNGVTPLVINLPVRHWSTLFRPQMWPFFVMDTERAFAFFWNFKIFGLLLAEVLFFGIITGRKTLLDCASALFLTFSPYVQWWFSTATCMPEMLAMFFFGLWLTAVTLRARSPWIAAVAALGVLFAAANFVFCCYPRFQVPLAYLAASVVFGGVFTADRLRSGFQWFRLLLLVSATAGAGAVIWFWFQEVAPVIRATSLLSYPGQVRSTGGGFSWLRLWAPFLEFSMTEQNVPAGYANVCEAAGFLFVAPLLAAAVVRDYFRGRRDRLSLIQVCVIAATLYFMVVGIPLWLAHISGWEYVYSSRAILLVGVATAIILARYLSRFPQAVAKPAKFRDYNYLAAATFLVIALLLTVNSRLAHFEATATVVAVALLFGLVSVCVWQRYVTCACILLVVPQLYSCAFINPVSQGLPGLTKSELLPWLATAHKRHPEGKWIVLGDSGRAQVLPEFVKATGAHALDGIHCNPDYGMLATLDPAGKYADIYDRYALLRFRRSDMPNPVLRGNAGLSYDIEMQMDPELLDRLQVRYILEVDIPCETPAVSGFHIAAERSGFRLLERN